MLNRLSTTALGGQSPADPVLIRDGDTAAADRVLFRDGVTAAADVVARAWPEADGLARACPDPSAPFGEDVGALL